MRTWEMVFQGPGNGKPSNLERTKIPPLRGFLSSKGDSDLGSQRLVYQAEIGRLIVTQQFPVL